MDAFLQQIVNGLVQGSIYALIALGYTMVYGILRIINFAHGDVMMVGAMVGLTTINWVQRHAPGLHWSIVFTVATLSAVLVCAALNYSIDRLGYKRLRNAPRLATLISAIGCSVIVQTLAMAIWSRNPLVFPQLLPVEPITVLQLQSDSIGVSMTGTDVATIGISFLLMAALLTLVNRTKIGRAMRATAENPQVASLMGIDPNRVISMTFILGGALAAVAGVMMASNYGSAHFYMGFLPGLKAFTAAVLGGVGNLGGAVAGGLLLGLIESLGSGYVGKLTGGVFGSNYQDVFAFIVLIAVLMFRPRGIMGERVADRA